jgi:hypothetical protein
MCLAVTSDTLPANARLASGSGGEELMIRYGEAKSNHRLMGLYGFCDPGNRTPSTLLIDRESIASALQPIGGPGLGVSTHLSEHTPRGQAPSRAVAMKRCC